MNRSESKKHHYIYKTTNLVNKKWYIGKHSTNNLEDGYLGSGTYLRRSVKKHGEQNFKKEILEYCDTYEKLNQREKEIVTEDIVKDPLCMNLKEGGLGGKSGEYKGDYFQGAKRYWEKPENKIRLTEIRKLANEKYVMKWNSLSDLEKQLILNKISWKDRKHKEESKRKIGVANSIKQLGNKNSQFGSCWITKEGINKKIKKEELESFITLGWNKGRK
jgi:hypothetical protein